MVAYDEITTRFLREREVSFIRTGLGLLINTYLITKAPMTAPMNAKGCGRMQLNILVLQQNLKNIESGVDLVRAADYFELFDQGVDAIVEKARQDASQGGDEDGKSDDKKFSYDELEALVELCYSEQLADAERGVAGAARRQMADKLLGLSEATWQTS